MRNHKIKQISKTSGIRIGKIIWHGFVILISLASIIEVIVGFIPVKAEYETSLRFFFMGLTFIGIFYEIVNFLFSSYVQKNNLKSEIEKGLVLSKDNKIDSSVLLEMENDLNAAFGITGDNTFHIIIVTACVNLNEAAYIDTIWRNINKNYKYLYVTPDSDQDFINSLISIFSQKGFGDLLEVYEKVIQNISHISDKALFNVLPDCYDLCLYFKDVNEKISIDGAKGYCCYQNELISDGDRQYAFYYLVSDKVIKNVFDYYSNEFQKELIYHSYISKPIEQKNSSINGQGLFCKTNYELRANELLLIKGGHELHKEEMVASKIIDSYMQIGDNLYLAAKTQEEEPQIKIFINHSCSPNVRIKNKRAFVSLLDIKEHEEITVDYSFIDNEPYRFKCNCGHSDCRKIVTGYDWQLRSVQNKHKKEYFSSYIQSKINTGISVDIKRGLDKQIKNLRREVFVDALKFKMDEEFEKDESKYIHCCLYEKNELIAYARVAIQDGNIRVGRVAVRKDKRRNGHGRQIMFWAETEALKHNRNDVEVHALSSVVDFYKKLGYVAVGEEFIEEGKPHLLMTKHLELDL